MTRILISAAERSGDAHAAHLVREIARLQPGIEMEGFGGDLMAASGVKLARNIIALASMGLGFLPNTGRYLRILRDFDRMLVEFAPDAVLLVDSPGLHFLFARLARWRGVPVIYYICPQIWAWAPWRRARVLRYTDLLLTILPFEEELYRNERVPVVHVGNPVGDSLQAVEPGAGAAIREKLRIPPDARVIGILPGSREREIRGTLPVFRSIIDGLNLDPTRHRLLISSFQERFRGAIEDGLMGCRIPHEVLLDDSRAIAIASDLVLVASGTASLEVAYFQKPMIVIYRVSRSARFLFQLYSVTPYFSLPNILSASTGEAAPIVPERLCIEDDASDLVATARSLLDDTPERRATIDALGRLREKVLTAGATSRAANAVVAFLNGGLGVARGRGTP